jgi:hypothetical protein
MVIQLELDVQLAEHRGPIRLHTDSFAAAADGSPAPAASSQPVPAAARSAGGRRRGRAACAFRAHASARKPQVAASTPATRDTSRTPTPRSSCRAHHPVACGQRPRSHPPAWLCCSRLSPSSSRGAGVSGDLPLTIAGAG